MERFTDDVAAHALADEPRPENLLYLVFAQTQTSQKAGMAFLQRLGARTAEPDGPSGSAVRDAQYQAIRAWGAPNGNDHSRLKAIKQPALIVNGTNDIMVPTINSLILAQNLPTGFLSLYPDAGHGAHFQYPELFTEEVTRFLRN
jgi:pimeloyl-ACP methyl ester carboxylesterase